MGEEERPMSQVSNLVSAFFITVDGKRYGPFHTRNEEKVERLLHHKGIEVEYCMVEKVNILPPPRKRRKKAENLKLDFGEGWIPLAKG
jgi:hypothetical protein